MNNDFKLKCFVCVDCGGMLQEVENVLTCPKHPNAGIISKGQWHQLQKKRTNAKKEDKRFANMTQKEALAFLEENVKLLGRLGNDFEGFD